MKWEYIFVVLARDGNNDKARFVNGQEIPNWKMGAGYMDYLNQLGEQGWEIITPDYYGEAHSLTGFYLKRSKQ